MNDAGFQKIFALHQRHLHNLEVPHAKLIVCFSAIAGSGKTTLAKAIEQRYRAVRISNDHIRRAIDQLDIAKDPAEQQRLLEQYLLRLFDYLQTQPNGLILLDSSIDRKYAEVKQHTEPLGYALLVIRIELPRSELERRIRERDKSKTNPEAYLHEFDRWIADNERFASLVKPDLTLISEQTLDFDNVFSFLDSRISPPTS